MASYADIAAKGPKQSPEEAKAHPVPSLQPEESESNSLVDVDSPHVSSVKSDYEDQAVKTETQANRLEHEAEDEARVAERKAERAAEKTKKEAKAKGKEVKDAVKKDTQALKDNTDNPVFIGNAILWSVAVVAIGYGAYQKHSEGKLDWKLAGTTAGLVGAVGVADYFGSKWLLDNKYPPK